MKRLLAAAVLAVTMSACSGQSRDVTDTPTGVLTTGSPSDTATVSSAPTEPGAAETTIEIPPTDGSWDNPTAVPVDPTDAPTEETATPTLGATLPNLPVLPLPSDTPTPTSS